MWLLIQVNTSSPTAITIGIAVLSTVRTDGAKKQTMGKDIVAVHLLASGDMDVHVTIVEHHFMGPTLSLLHSITQTAGAW